MAPTSAGGGRRVLVVEDEPLISLILAGDLRDEGYVTAGPFSRCDETLAWLQHDTPDLAIIDYMLRDGPCTRLARILSERGVPFVVFSGYPRGPDMPEEFGNAPWFEKPASLDDLLAAFAELSARGAAARR
jgi:DNA-binding response OmpR family regulator